MWRRVLRLFFIALLGAGLPLGFPGELRAERGIRVEVPSVVHVDATAFMLGDIARIYGSDSAREALSPLLLSSEGGFLARESVVRAIEASGLDGVRVEVRMPQRVRVLPVEAGEARSHEAGLSPDENLSSVIKSLAAWDGGVEVAHSGTVPQGRLVSPASLVPGTPAATLRFRDAGGRERSLGVRLTWTQNVLVMARSVPRDRPLAAADLTTRSMRIARPGVYATQASEVVGRSSRKPLQQGTPVLLELLSEPAVAKRGGAVLIVVRQGGLTATAKGVLLDDGAVGAVVRVRRSDNKKVVLRARVLDGDTVEVDVP